MTSHSACPSAVQTITTTATVASGVFAPGHLGELTQIVPFEMVDEALAAANSAKRRTRRLPARVVVYPYWPATSGRPDASGRGRADAQ